jgi:hypothetical protein
LYFISIPSFGLDAQETSRDFGTSTSDVEQLGLTTAPSIKVEPGNDSRLS